MKIIHQRLFSLFNKNNCFVDNYKEIKIENKTEIKNENEKENKKEKNIFLIFKYFPLIPF